MMVAFQATSAIRPRPSGRLAQILARMIPGTNAMPANPQTLDELFAPLFRLVSRIGDGGETATQKEKAK